MPAATVLMTVRNGMPYLPLAIESILNQSFRDFEFLIVDDNSSDNTRDVILSYDDARIRLLENKENIGQTRSLNRGLEYAQAELIARMDADDISHSNRLEMQVAFLREHREVAVVGTNLRLIDQAGRLIRLSTRYEHDLGIRWKQLFGCPISCGAAMFRKDVVWEELGGFDSSIQIVQDWELWSRLLPKYRAANLRDYLLDVRIHPAQAGTTFHRIRLEENRAVIRVNPRRILRINDDSKEWIAQVDALITIPVAHPEKRLEVIERFFERFCTLYPDAREHPEVRKELLRQYLIVLNHTELRSFPTALKVIWLVKAMSSKELCVSRFPVLFLAWLFKRWPIVRASISRLKRWVRRVLDQLSIKP